MPIRLMNMVYGHDGRDSLHGSGDDGACRGGNPSSDNTCIDWEWPEESTSQGDCCCTSCYEYSDCTYQDMGHGAPSDYDPW